MEGRKGCVERLQAMMLARKLPYFNTKTLTLEIANLEHEEGFRDFSYVCELVGWRRRFPLASPIIVAPRGGRLTKEGGQAASPCVALQNSEFWIVTKIH
jgi:hypothetical protein